MEGSDRCNEPKIDCDRWEQYCFTDQGGLGPGHLFIELHIDWAEWVSRQPDYDEVKTKKERVLETLAELAELGYHQERA